MDQETIKKLEELNNFSQTHFAEIKAKYLDWLNRTTGRTMPPSPFGLFIPITYSRIKAIRAFVGSLICDLHDNDESYHKNRSLVEHLLSEAVAMTMFFSEQMKENESVPEDTDTENWNPSSRGARRWTNFMEKVREAEKDRFFGKSESEAALEALGSIDNPSLQETK